MFTKMVYALGSNAVVNGPATDIRYMFKQGVPVEVYDSDVSGLLNMTKIQGGCCGIPPTKKHLFQLYD